MNILLFSAILFFALGVLLWFKNSYRLSFLSIFTGGFVIALHAIFLDDFLHPFDERYHALVALNAMKDPFHLKLVPELLTSWNTHTYLSTRTWLHKQPLFTWQMALGMKVFGTSVYGMRSASVLMFLVLGFAVYRACKLYFPKSAVWCILIVYSSPFLLLLTTGRKGMDHNDIAFAAYTSLAFWAFISYTKKPNLKYAVALGIACGAAMLTKWLAGSLVMFSFGLYLLLTKNYSLKGWKHLISAALIALAVFTPWQIYSYLQFPELFIHEWKYNSLHFSQALEGHQHNWNYHLIVWSEEFLALLILSLGSVFTHRKIPKSPQTIWLTVAISFVAVLLFYTIAATKLKAFTIILVPYAAFLAAQFMEWALSKPKRKLVIIPILALIFIKFFVSYVNDSPNEKSVNQEIKYKVFCENLREKLPPETVVFNTPPYKFTEMTFYTHLTSYDKLPSKTDIDNIHKLGREACILIPPDQQVDSLLATRTIIISADSIQSLYP